jgi:cytochrome c oxidase subunit IV
VAEDEGQRKQPSKKQKASNEAMEQSIKPKQSYWPFALAASLTVTLVGVILMSHPIVFWVGVALVVVSFVGWGLERH